MPTTRDAIPISDLPADLLKYTGWVENETIDAFFSGRTNKPDTMEKISAMGVGYLESHAQAGAVPHDCDVLVDVFKKTGLTQSDATKALRASGEILKHWATCSADFGGGNPHVLKEIGVLVGYLREVTVQSEPQALDKFSFGPQS